MKRLFAALLGLVPLLAGCGPGGPFSPYHQKGGAWYFEKTQLPVPKGQRLTVLNNRFAKTDAVVFYRDSRIEGADAATFQALTEHYAKDRTAVYYADTYRDGQEYYAILHTRIAQISGANPATFRLLDVNDAITAKGYAKDEDQVWYEGRPMAGVDAPSFTPLRGLFARDSRTVYYDLEPMPGPDPRSFQAIDDNWSRDARQVYWSDIDLGSDPPGAHVQRVAEGADPATFEMLDGGYGKDGRHVWHEGVLVEGADPATFSFQSSVGDWDASDSTGRYKEGRRLAAQTPVAPAAGATPKS
ncbi:MAG: DKNYY domain-containing protein [Caulobacteraceae bacterium]|nr:DKNYY domain-containing protein [Caulobacteraceae bacterium]